MKEKAQLLKTQLLLKSARYCVFGKKASQKLRFKCPIPPLSFCEALSTAFLAKLRFSFLTKKLRFKCPIPPLSFCEAFYEKAQLLVVMTKRFAFHRKLRFFSKDELLTKNVWYFSENANLMCFFCKISFLVRAASLTIGEENVYRGCTG